MNGYTRMAPGVFEVEFEEEIFHTGAPFRFALGIGVQDDNFDLFVLADHIPHNVSLAFVCCRLSTVSCFFTRLLSLI